MHSAKTTTSGTLPLLAATALLTGWSAPPARAQTITPIINVYGDGTHDLVQARGLAVDAWGNVFVAGEGDANLFKVEPDGTITQVIDTSGDGAGNTLVDPIGVAVDAAGNAYVTGFSSRNAFKIATDGTITEIIDASGDGAGNSLAGTFAVAVDAAGDVYVTGQGSNNAFKITDPGGANVITQIIGPSGDGAGNSLNAARGVAVDLAGNCYVTGLFTHNAFKITPGGTITQIIDTSGDGAGHALLGAYGVAVDTAGDVYVVGRDTNNAFRIKTTGSISQVIDSTGDGLGNPLFTPVGVAVDSLGTVYLSGASSDNVFEIAPGGVITEVIDSWGDGLGHSLHGPAEGLAVDEVGRVYVSGYTSSNAFKIGAECNKAVVFCDTGPNNTAGIGVDTCECAAPSLGVILSGAPSGQFTYLLVGAGTGVLTDPPGALGDLCLTGAPIGRYVQDAGMTSVTGNYSTDVLNADTGGGGGTLPNPPGGNLCTPPGQTWNFQYWHRDGMNPSRFSQALAVTFQ